jgi:hypothetical protein
MTDYKEPEKKPTIMELMNKIKSGDDEPSKKLTEIKTNERSNRETWE